MYILEIIWDQMQLIISLKKINVDLLNNLKYIEGFKCNCKSSFVVTQANFFLERLRIQMIRKNGGFYLIYCNPPHI
ncbi:hypothetical protein CAB17_11525 [Legionella sainthelensi]|uniref:Uncharacterized protein n=1 Tax=Legionella sainthelensi TaxID=28087 RepID=A0A2H5FM49_9GAMM|nr:hypothetical protein CAB17_11525 [Legionella sainthelensi]